MAQLRIDELAIPATGLGLERTAFAGAVAVGNTVVSAALGAHDLDLTASEELPGWQDQRYEIRRLFVARSAGHIVGRAIYEHQTEENQNVAWISVEVLPEFRRRGVGTRLWERMRKLYAELGHTVLQSYAVHGAETSSRMRWLASPTGVGRVPLDEGSRFLLRAGFALEQVERISRLPVPADLAAHESAALAAAADDYRLLAWAGQTPKEYLSDLALLYRRMSTDAPSAALAAAEENWDEARVRHADRVAAEDQRTRLVCAVEHRPSERLVGFTVLVVPPETHRAVEQLETLVLREHRGHRLGMLLKIANLRNLERRFPGHPSVVTFNAEENSHMLAVNEAIGFQAIGFQGLWKHRAG